MAEPSGEENTSRPASGDSTSDSTGDRPNHPDTSPITAILNHYTINKLEAVLMATRLLTCLFALMYLLPFGGSTTYFRKVLIANAATSALRLHQRMPQFQFSGEFMSQLLSEDSCHYLLYSIIFLISEPLTLVIMPLVLFALLHVASSALTLLDKVGHRQSPLGNNLSYFIEQYQKTILLTVALSEVILMPIIILAIFTGVTSMITPFLYYRFLALRYASRRNPYTRQTFQQLRMATQQMINLPGCPTIIRRGMLSVIDIICRLAPPIQLAQ